MAYFQRVERNELIICGICKVGVNEAGLTNHITRCKNSAAQAKKFTSGDIEMCKYDSNHVVNRGHMENHLEFCNKYQSILAGEYQRLLKDAEANSLVK